MTNFIARSARLLKRHILTGGYARPVHGFLRTIHEVPNRLPPDTFTVNLSFDLEYAYNTSFWMSDFGTAIEYGKRAYERFAPISEFLHEQKIQHNVQIVGMLLDPLCDRSPLLSESHRAVMKEHPLLFTLSPEHASLLKQSYADVGLHGYSHRLFTNLNQSEAEDELNRACSNFSTYFGTELPNPTFMSFPRNKVAHTDVLLEHGIQAWRSNRQVVEQKNELPLGLWFAPGTFGVRDFRRLLRHIRRERPSFLLHLWNHFTEMDSDTFKAHIEVITEEGWDCMSARELTEKYG